GRAVFRRGPRAVAAPAEGAQRHRGAAGVRPRVAAPGRGREGRGLGRRLYAPRSPRSELGLLSRRPHRTGVRSAALHGLSLSLARQPRLVAFSRSLVRRVPPRDRVARLPPHAGLIVSRGRRYYLPLDARRARSPLGFLPRDVREALARRRGIAATSFTAA